MAAQAHRTGIPLIRPLWLTFPSDKLTYLIDDSYMWGDSFLVAPIFSRGATERSVYLPEGVWFDYWTGQRQMGDQSITAEAKLDRIPLYLKAGSIIPFGPIKQYASEPSAESTALQIYPGADGYFDWYDDDGISFDYEHGKYLLAHCRWEEKKQIFTFTRDPAGHGIAQREFRIGLAGSNVTQTVSTAKDFSIRL